MLKDYNRFEEVLMLGLREVEKLRGTDEGFFCQMPVPEASGSFIHKIFDRINLSNALGIEDNVLDGIFWQATVEFMNEEYPHIRQHAFTDYCTQLGLLDGEDPRHVRVGGADLIYTSKTVAFFAYHDSCELELRSEITSEHDVSNFLKTQ